MEGFDDPPPCYLPDPGKIETIDEGVMKQLIQIGFVDGPKARQEILEGQKTQLVATYKLLLQKKLDAKKRRDEARRRKKEGEGDGLKKRTARDDGKKPKTRKRSSSYKKSKKKEVKIIKDEDISYEEKVTAHTARGSEHESKRRSRPRAVSSASPR